MLDSTPSITDKPANNSDVHAKLSASAEVPVGSKPNNGSNSSDSSVSHGLLPHLSINGIESSIKGLESTLSENRKANQAVEKDIHEGEWNEITKHPLQVIESGAIGLGIGAVATVAADAVVAAGAAVGVTLAAPEVLVGGLVVGAAYGGYELYKHAGSWINAEKTVEDTVKDPASHTAAQVAQAHAVLQGLGAGEVKLAAGIGGGIVGGAISGVAAAGVGDVPAGSVPDPDTAPPVGGPPDLPPPPAQSGDVPATPAPAAATLPADAPASPAPAQATPPSDAPASPAPAQATPPAEAPASPAPAQATPPADAPAPKGDAPAEAPKLTAEEQAVADSVKANQAIFSAADQDNGLMTAGKQDYNVRFQKVTEPTQIQSLEGLKTGTTETVQPGQWIATRLNADGSPNIENGIENSWGVTDKTILKTYQATPADLQNSELVAATRTNAPPVHMVQLKAPLTIKTPWGTMSGEPGDYLANYDYANGQPGDSYAIITKTSFDQTYRLATGGDVPAAAAPAIAIPGDAQAPPADAPAPAAPKTVGAVPEGPFTVADTTMKVSNPSAWAADVAANGNSDVGSAILRFSNNWATQMEEQMAAGNPITPAMVNATERAADTEGLSGSMYQQALGALIRSWQYGPQLEAITNPQS